MWVVVDNGDSARGVEVAIRAQDATLADLLSVLGEACDRVLVDGRPVAPCVTVAEAGVVNGSAIELVGPRSPQRWRERFEHHPDLILEVIDGLIAGRRWRLRDGGDYTVGSSPGADIRLDGADLEMRHAVLSIRDGAARYRRSRPSGGPRGAGRALCVGDTLMIAGCRLRLRAGEGAAGHRLLSPRRATQAGLVTFNRRPRVSSPVEQARPEPPERPQEPAAPPRLSLMMVIAPLLLGAAMAIMFRNPMFAAFVVLSPVLALSQWSSSRRRHRQQLEADETAFRDRQARYKVAVQEWAQEEKVRLSDAHPDLGQVAWRVMTGAAELWERRPDHDDHLVVAVGSGPSPDLFDQQRPIDVPIPVELTDGAVVGVVGPSAPVRALVRGMIAQVFAHHGPVDAGFRVEPAASGGRGAVPGEWAWLGWLPHTRPGSDAVHLIIRDRLSPAIDHVGYPGEVGGPALAKTSLQDALSHRSVIELAPSVGELPASCTTVVEIVGADSLISVRYADGGCRRGRAAGLDRATTLTMARTLARYRDPEIGAGLADQVQLNDLADLSCAGIVHAWQLDQPAGSRRRDTLAVDLGLTDAGPAHIDLVRDGPHALVAGTTGSGKSELLRTWLMAMAARYRPSEVSYLLIDYKGGSAFDACAGLPHTTAVVTDLDDQLAERALASLDAEVRRREAVLRASGRSTYEELDEVGEEAPMPRLAVVVDEFATLAAELPTFLDALVGIAQRGRSLGIHLLLATQRPAGAVREAIRANTAIRICLRVQSAADSRDVIDDESAASLPRSVPGRAVVRLGPGELEVVQIAATCESWPVVGSTQVELLNATAGPVVQTPTTLAVAVGEVNQAFSACGLTRPKPCFLPPLPTHLEPAGLSDSDEEGFVTLGLADHPSSQSQQPDGWSYGQGHGLFVGLAGSGITRTLGLIVTQIARNRVQVHVSDRVPTDVSDRVQVHVLDGAASELSSLAALRPVGSVIGSTETERRMRLLRVLSADLDRRSTLGRDHLSHEPQVVLLIDGVGQLLVELDAVSLAARAMFDRLFFEGPALGLTMAIGAVRVGELPLTMTSTITQQWIFRCRDEPGGHGMRAGGSSSGDQPPGRARRADTGISVQMAWSTSDLAEVVRRMVDEAEGRETNGCSRRVPTIDVFPPKITAADLDESSGVEADGRAAPAAPLSRLALGLLERDRQVARLDLLTARHLLICGPRRSGRTSALLSIAEELGRVDKVRVVAMADPRSALSGARVDEWWDPDRADIAELDGDGPTVVLVDDAEATAATGTVALLLEGGRRDVHVIAAARSDAARTAFGHWLTTIRRSGAGLLLRPGEIDGDLFSVDLPRKPVVPLVPGRGYLIVDGTVEMVQMTSPGDP